MMRTRVARRAGVLAATALLLSTSVASADTQREAENTTIGAGSVAIDYPGASGGRAVGLYITNASVSFTATTEAVDDVVVRAAGSNCFGNPVLRVVVDGKTLGDQLVSGGWQEYRFDAGLPAGVHKVDLLYVNDLWFFCDRNLFLDTIRMTVPVVTPPPPTTTPTTPPTTTMPPTTTTTTTPPTTTTTTPPTTTTTTTTTTQPPPPPGIPALWDDAPPAGVSPAPAGPPSGAGFDAAPLAGNELWDNFNGPSGSNPDPRLWLEDTINQGGTQTYNPARSFLDGSGHAVLEAVRNSDGSYQSGRFTSRTKFNMQYGWLAARIKFPSGQGFFPAYWLLHANLNQRPYAEVDMMEFFGPATRYETHLHFGDNNPIASVKDVPANHGDNASNGYHTYWMQWSPGRIQIGVDELSMGTFTTANRADFAEHMNQAMYFILNFAVAPPWLPAPTPGSFPARYLIDWIWYKPGG